MANRKNVNHRNSDSILSWQLNSIFGWVVEIGMFVISFSFFFLVENETKSDESDYVNLTNVIYIHTDKTLSKLRRALQIINFFLPDQNDVNEVMFSMVIIHSRANIPHGQQCLLCFPVASTAVGPLSLAWTPI